MIRSPLAAQFMLSPNIEPRRNNVKPDMVILHYTGMDDAERACSWLCNPISKVSCHYLVDEKGMITQIVDESMRAWHAGVSSWKGAGDINSHSIGIEIQNPGHSNGYPDFPLVQMKSVVRLCNDILSRNDIRPERILAHSDIAPMRKIDPGEKFDWQLLHAEGIGHWVVPEPIVGGPMLKQGDTGEEVTEFQKQLRLYGYGVAITGRYDALTKSHVQGFQRHFRPERVDGIADVSTITTLQKLLEALPSA
jgi:N-acetylmuramoyl-L-alanine amidase